MGKISLEIPLEFIYRAGYSSIGQFARLNDLHLAQTNELLNGTRSPVRKNGEWRTIAMVVADCLGEHPDDLWPNAARDAAIERDWRAVAIAEEFTAGPATPELDDVVEMSELRAAIKSVLNTLPVKHQEVLELRFGLSPCGEMLYNKEIATRFGISTARVQQIEEQALQRLRHPKRAKALNPFVQFTTPRDGDRVTAITFSPFGPSDAPKLLFNNIQGAIEYIQSNDVLKGSKMAWIWIWVNDAWFCAEACRDGDVLSATKLELCAIRCYRKRIMETGKGLCAVGKVDK